MSSAHSLFNVDVFIHFFTIVLVQVCHLFLARTSFIHYWDIYEGWSDCNCQGNDRGEGDNVATVELGEWRLFAEPVRLGEGLEGMVANMNARIVSEVQTVKMQDWCSAEKLGTDV